MPPFLTKRPVLISLIVVLALVAYLIFTVIFTLLFQYNTALQVPPTPTPAPTFTAVPTATPLMAAAIPTATLPPLPTLPNTPAATASPLPTATDAPVPPASPTLTATETPSAPQVLAGTAVNVRQGPGTNYQVLGQLPPGQSLPVVGQNLPGTWWQVPLPNGARGWIAASVVKINGPVNVPVVQALPPPAPPTATPPPPEPPAPQFQYEPSGWYADTNYGLTRFLGTITDAGGNPVNGVSVEAQCGDFRVISNPSGPVGWPPFYDSGGDPPGFWDLTLDTKPIPCTWFLTIVESPDGKTVIARMSDAIEVETTVEESIITANWQKNW